MKRDDICYFELDGELYQARDDGFCRGHGFMVVVSKGRYSLRLACPECGRSVDYERCVEMSE